MGRREFRDSVEDGADDRLARRRRPRTTMTTTEQILWAHRVDKNAERASPARPCASTPTCSRPPTAPRRFRSTRSTRSPAAARSSRARPPIANDHFVFTGKDADDRQTGIGRAFAAMQQMEKPYYATPGDGIFHFYFPEQGSCYPGQFIPGADSHSRAYGAYGAIGIGVGSTTLGFGWSTGYVYTTVPQARRVVFRGRSSRGCRGKDIVLKLLERWGTKQSQGMSVEFVDAGTQLPIAYRNTIANMMAEAESYNGIFAPDEITVRLVPREGDDEPSLPGRWHRARRRSTRSTRSSELTGVVPMIAKPFSPGNAFPADEVAKERIAFDKAYIGSCTNGSYDDLPAGRARAPRREADRADEGGEGLRRLPGSGGVARMIEAQEPAARRRVDRGRAPRRRREDPAIRGADPASARAPTRWPRASARSPRSTAIGRTAWAWAAKAYLASPAVVAASALVGYMAPPSELGLGWQADEFGV